MGSQCWGFETGVICSLVLLLVRIHAAEFSTSWRRFRALLVEQIGEDYKSAVGYKCCSE